MKKSSKKTTKKKAKEKKGKAPKNPFARLAKDTGERTRHGSILHEGDTTIVDGGGIERVRISLPYPENKEQAQQIVDVALERAERIYRHELDSSMSFDPGLRKGMRSPAKSALDFCHGFAYRYGLSVPTASGLRSSIKADMRKEA